jgi:hypothetical protein
MNLDKIPDQGKPFNQLCRVFYLISLIAAAWLFYMNYTGFLNGLAMGTFIMSAYAYYHFYHSDYDAEGQIENSLTYMLTILFILGFAIIVVNHYYGRSPFMQGFGAAVSLYSSFMYCNQLFRNYMCSVR